MEIVKFMEIEVSTTCKMFLHGLLQLVQKRSFLFVGLHLAMAEEP